MPQLEKVTMNSTVKRRQQNSEDSEHCSTNKKGNRFDFYLRIKAWLLHNYEVESGSFTFKQDIFDHILKDKESVQISEDDVPTRFIVTRAINELWIRQSGIVYVSKKNVPGAIRSPGKTARRRAYGYSNLKKKNEVEGLQQPLNFTEDNVSEWPFILEKAISGLASENGWQVHHKTDGISFIHINPFSFDGQRALTEIVFTHSAPVDIQIKYHQHSSVNLDEVPAIKSQIEDYSLVEKAKFLLKYFNKTSLCRGFPKSDLTPVTEFPNTKCYLFKDLKQPEKPEEYRLFSESCQLFSNSNGICCSSCKKLEYLYRKKRKRCHENQGTPSAYCNHRYMTKDQMIEKVKRQRLQLSTTTRRYQIKKLEKELLEMDMNVQEDLAKIPRP